MISRLKLSSLCYKLSVFSVRNVLIFVWSTLPSYSLQAADTHCTALVTFVLLSVGCRPGLGVVTAELRCSLDKSQRPSSNEVSEVEFVPVGHETDLVSDLAIYDVMAL